MTDQYFNNACELIDKFGVRDLNEYEHITPLTDRKVGFSVQRKYPQHIRYVPPKTKKGEDDVVALIHIIYNRPVETKLETDALKIPLVVRVGAHSRYRQNHFDYDFNDEDCPTKESLAESKQTSQPISLDYIDEFFFDHTNNAFVDRAGKAISGQDILERVFREHLDTTHLIKGLKLRLTLRAQCVSVSLLTLLSTFIVFLLKKFFGRTIDESDNLASFYWGYETKDFKKLSTDSLDVFGYKTSRSVIMVFCFVVALAYGVKYVFSLSTPYLKAVFSDNFLSIIHALLVLGFLDVVAPYMLFHVLNFLIRLRTKIMFATFKDNQQKEKPPRVFHRRGREQRL